MSDLTASQCGCGHDDNNGCSSLIWLIILLSIFGNGCGCGCGGGSSLFGGRDSDNGCGCESLIIILLLLSCCGGCGCR